MAIKKFKENTEEDEIVKKTTMREVKMLRLLKQQLGIFHRKNDTQWIKLYTYEILLELVQRPSAHIVKWAIVAMEEYRLRPFRSNGSLPQ